MSNSILSHKVSSKFEALLHRSQLNKIVRKGTSRVRLKYLLLLLLAPAAMAQTTTNFSYNGSSQSYTVPANTYSISVRAAGGPGGTGTGSVAVAGAVMEATLTVVPGEVLTVNVGGAGYPGVAGLMAAGGYNGGATGNNNQGGGGGATDLRRAIANGRTTDYLASRNAMLVAAGAGGGGGGGGNGSAGGAAGLYVASGGKGGGTSGGYGGTQTAPGAGGDIAGGVAGGVGVGAAGSEGTGGSGGALGNNSGGGGGGGGGYFGGGGGSSNVVGTAGGGGASSWVMETGSSAIGSQTPTSASAGSMSITTTTPKPLPMVLARFAATAMGPEAVHLAWATATELNSASFAVERSTDGQAFISLVTLTGAGTSSSAIAYDWIDALLPATHKALYYRLRQTDLDATVTYSPVRIVTQTAACATAQLQAYPNPAHHMVSVKVSGGALSTPVKEYQVFNSQGRLVRTQATSEAGTESFLPLTGLPVGTYLLRYGSLTQHLTVE